MAVNNALEEAYAHCQSLASSHYENFPVASVLLPKHLRRPISAIYAFARTADDFADEGKLSDAARLNALNDYSKALQYIAKNRESPDNSAIFTALTDTIQQHTLDIRLLDDLLTAFKQDVTQSHYQTHDDVIAYCRHSANPVGRLLLQLHGYTDNTRLQQSDAICTALQLINFYQDIQDDYQQRDRIYLPQEDMAKHHIIETDLAKRTTSAEFNDLMQQQYQRVADLLHIGMPLGLQLMGRFGWEIRTTILAACSLLHTLKHRPANQQLERPHLSKAQLGKLLVFSLRKKTYSHTYQNLK
jgi:squalene synthase HpnC